MLLYSAFEKNINKNISFSIESTAPKYQNIFDTDWASGSTIDWGSTGTTDEFKVHAVGGELKMSMCFQSLGLKNNITID